MKTGIIGLGYVGLPSPSLLSKQVTTWSGLNADSRKTEGLARGDSYIEDICNEVQAPLVEHIDTENLVRL